MSTAPAASTESSKQRGLTAPLLLFNSYPIDYVHDSWLASLPHTAIFDQLKHAKRARLHLTRYLNQALALTPVDSNLLDSKSTQLILLDSGRLSTLVLFAGIATDAERVKHIILKTELQALKTAIGESGYSFALKRAPFLGKIPEALSVSSLQADEYHEHFTLCGLRCLGLALSQIDSAILSRFVLKFPMAHKESLTAPPMSASDEDASNALLLINRIAAELELFNA